MASYLDENGNPIIVTYDQIVQNVYDPRAKGIRTIGGVSAQTVTPSDSADLPKGVCRGLYVGTTGNIAVDMADGSTITLNGLSAGIIHSIAVRKVHATGTTASNIVAFY